MELKITNSVIFLAMQISMIFGVCVDEKYSTIPGHTGCISKSPSATHFRNMTTSVKDEIVNTHNNLRSQLNAANMQKMVWDDELATLAQMWADNCQFRHDSGKHRSIPGRYSVGQNLAAGQRDWSKVVNAWWSEIKYFRYNNQKAMEFKKVGHFTQVAWAKSSKVGCGWAICTNPEMKRFRGRFYVCNYAPAGNMRWWMPYREENDDGERGKCASCPESCDSNGLCDCGGKICLNRGTLDVNTCQCNCRKPFHTPDICELNCQAAKDFWACGKNWKVPHCKRYANVPTECPHMCGLCPTAD